MLRGDGGLQGSVVVVGEERGMVSSVVGKVSDGVTPDELILVSAPVLHGLHG